MTFSGSVAYMNQKSGKATIPDELCGRLHLEPVWTGLHRVGSSIVCIFRRESISLQMEFHGI